MCGELPGEVVQGVKAAAGIEALLILAVTSLHFTVVARCIGADELVPDTQPGGGGLKQSRKVPLAAGEAIGKFKAVIRLDAFHADSPAGIPLEQLFEKICGGIGGTPMTPVYHPSAPSRSKCTSGSCCTSGLPA